MNKIVSVLATLVLTGTSVAFAAPAQAEDSCTDTALGPLCLSIADGQVRVEGPGVSLAEPIPETLPITLAPIRVEVPVPGPVVTVTAPPTTVPGPTRTVTVPGPTRVVTKTVTPAPVLRTKTETITVPQLTTLPGTTTTVTRTVTVKVAPAVKTRVVTVTQAVTFSLVALFVGALLMVGLLYLMYRIGRREGEDRMTLYMLDLMRVLARRKR